MINLKAIKVDHTIDFSARKTEPIAKGCPFSASIAYNATNIHERREGYKCPVQIARSDCDHKDKYGDDTYNKTTIRLVQDQMQTRIQHETNNGHWSCGGADPVSVEHVHSNGLLRLIMPTPDISPIVVPPTMYKPFDPAAMKCVKRMALQAQAVFGSKVTDELGQKSIAHTVARIGDLARYMIEQFNNEQPRHHNEHYSLDTAIASAKYLLDQEDFSKPSQQSNCDCAPLVQDLAAIVLGSKLFLLASNDPSCDDDASDTILERKAECAWILGKLYSVLGWVHHSTTCSHCATYSLPVLLNGYATYMHPLVAVSKHTSDSLRRIEAAIGPMLTCRTRAMAEVFYVLAYEPMAAMQYLARETCGNESAAQLTRIVSGLYNTFTDAKVKQHHVLYHELVQWAAEKCVGREYEIVGLALSMAPFSGSNERLNWTMHDTAFSILSSNKMMAVGDSVRTWTFVWRKQDHVLVLHGGRRHASLLGKQQHVNSSNVIMNYSHNPHCCLSETTVSAAYPQHKTLTRQGIDTCYKTCVVGSSEKYHGPLKICKTIVPNGKLKESVQGWCQTLTLVLDNTGENSHDTAKVIIQELGHMQHLSDLSRVVEEWNDGSKSSSMHKSEKARKTCESCVEQLLDNILELEDVTSDSNTLKLTSAIRTLCNNYTSNNKSRHAKIAATAYLSIFHTLHDRLLCWPTASEIWCGLVSCLQVPELRMKLCELLLSKTAILTLTPVGTSNNTHNTPRHVNMYTLSKQGQACQHMLETCVSSK